MGEAEGKGKAFGGVVSKWTGNKSRRQGKAFGDGEGEGNGTDLLVFSGSGRSSGVVGLFFHDPIQ